MILPRAPPGRLPTQAASGTTPRYSGQRGLQQRMVIAAQGAVWDGRGAGLPLTACPLPGRLSRGCVLLHTRGGVSFSPASCGPIFEERKLKNLAALFTFPLL